MPINILMPALSPTMEKGNLAKWLKKEGEAVKPGDVIAEIETDKATMEVEAIDEGVMAKILVPEGTTDVPVNQVIAILDGEGSTAAPPAAAGSAAPAQEAAPPAPALQPRTPVASDDDPPPAHPQHPPASPLARRLARERGIDLSQVKGSGPHGRIIARDVENARPPAPRVAAAPVAASPSQTAPSPTASSPPVPGPATAPATTPVSRTPLSLPPSDEAIAALFEPGSYDVVPHDQIRKIIAQRLTLAKQTIPHFYLTMDCAIDALLSAREAINAAAPKAKDGAPAYKISVNDFVIKALALALQRVPDANVTWTESGMLRHRRSDIGVAVAIPGGLITPVVRGAQAKTLSAISIEMKDFAARARTRRLKPQEYQGGSTAISNLGMYGVKNFAAVINPPHATILAVGAGEPRAVVRNAAPGVATLMTVTLSTDHRAVDGALGAELLDAFKRFIENPVEMLV